MLKIKKLFLPIVTSLALSFSVTADTDIGEIKKQAPGFSTGLIIKYKNSNKSAGISDSISKAKSLSKDMGMNLTFVREMSGDAEVLKIDTSQKNFTKASITHLIEELNKRGDIEYAEIDEMQQAFSVPNDTLYNTQWHYFEEVGGINLPNAWDITTGSTAVTVAVVDSGYRPHPDLVGNIVGEYDMITDLNRSVDGDGRDANAQDPGDFNLLGECPGNPPKAKDSSWHGTHVGGTVAASSNNNSGVAGVAWDVNLVMVRALGKCGGSTSDIADGIRWAAGINVPGVPANPNPAQVINLSLGSKAECGFTYQSAMTEVFNAGVTVVVSSGNANEDSIDYRPSNCNGVISVAATSRRGARAHYSNFGSQIDISAPGGEECEPVSDARPMSISDCAGGVVNYANRVVSTLNSGDTVPEDDVFGRYQGTSMAAPHIAGLAALIYSVNPDLTPTEVKDIMVSTARPFPNVSNHQCTTANCGSGIIDAHAALLAVSNNSSVIELENGVPQSSLSGIKDSQKNFTLDVPANATGLSFDMSAGTGDADMYVKFGSAPTLTDFDCRPYNEGNNENCTFANAQVGTYYVLINGYTPYSNVSLVGNYTVVPPSSNNELINDEEVTGLSANQGNMIEYFITVPEGADDLFIEIYGGTGDADLHVKYGSPATLSSYDCKPYKDGNHEACDFHSPQAGTYHIMINAYNSFSDLTLFGSYTVDDEQETLFSSGTNVNIPDNNPAGATSDIVVDRTGETGSARITYNIIHTYRNDITVKYIDSTGATRTLRSPSGGSDDNISESKVVSLGATPANGTWKLKVIDSVSADTGYIDSWSIEFLD